MLLCPGFDGDGELAGGGVAPPGFCDGGEVAEAEVVEVDEEPVGFFFGGFFEVGGVGFYFEFGCVDGLGSGADKDVECER